MSQPAARIGPLEGLQQPMPATAAPPSQTASDALPMLTPLQSLSSQPSASQQFQPQPPPQSVLPIPQASPRIKPPPASGSFSLSQAGMPLWQMLGSAANTPIVGAGMSISNDSLDLDHLAKAAVRKRKQQERQSAEVAARDSVITELHRRAAHQAAVSALAQQHAINWLQASIDTEDAEYVRHHMDIIQTMLSEKGLLPEMDSEPPPTSAAASTVVAPARLADVGTAGKATILAAVQAAAEEQAQGLVTAVAIQDPVAAATAKAAAVDRAAAVVNAAITDASAAEATAHSGAAVAALQAAAAGGAAPAVAVAQAVDEAAKALAAAKAKATATAEAALQAAVAQEQQRVMKKANQQLFAPLTQGLGGLVDYPSDEDSHMSRAPTDSQTQPTADKCQAEVSSAERRALAAKQGQSSMSQAMQAAPQQSTSLLPMYSMDLSSSHQQASSAGGLGDMQADATGGFPRAGHLRQGVGGLAGAELPCSHLSGQQLGEVLDSMRELSSVHMNLSLLHGTGVLAFVEHLKQSPEASIAFMAGTMASQWRGSLACHLQTVTLRWPMRNLQHETSQLVVQCANKWGLAFPPAPEATPALLTQGYASGGKKKRKRDGWDNKKGGKGAAALLRASGSAPEAHIVNQLSQAREAAPNEARQLKRDLQTLHSDPATLPQPTLAPTPAVASTHAGTNQPAPQVSAAALSDEIGAQQAASAQVPSRPSQATTSDKVDGASDTAAATAAAARPADDKSPVSETAQDAAEAAAKAVPLAAPESEVATADKDSSAAPSAVAAQQTDGLRTPHEPTDADIQRYEGKQKTAQDTHDNETDASDRREQQQQQQQQQESDIAAEVTKAASEPNSDQPAENSKQKGHSKQKGKRKPPPKQKGSAKRQRTTLNESAEAAPAAAVTANRAAVPPAAAADTAAASSSDEESLPGAAVGTSLQAGAAKGKKQAAAVAHKGKTAAAQKLPGRAAVMAGAHAKKPAAAAIAKKAAAEARSKKASARRDTANTAAADSGDDDSDMLDDEAVGKAQTRAEGEEERGGDSDAEIDAEANSPPAASTRDRRAKSKDAYKPSAQQPPPQARKPAKQQKLSFTNASAGSTKQGKALAASAAVSDDVEEPGLSSAGKAAKGRAGADKKSAASAEPVSAGKETKGKVLRASPKSASTHGKPTTKSQAKAQAKLTKQQKQRPAEDEDSSDQDAAEQAESDSEEAVDDTPVGRAVAYLAQQQMDIAASPYLQLKPLVLNTSKGTLERLSDLPGWKRQSARKKHFAVCDSALQACLAKHKAENAEVTKKRHKKEVLRLLSDLCAAVKDLAA